MSKLENEIVKLVEDFISILEKLLADGIITQEQFDQMVSNKIKFLNKIKK